MRSFSRKLKYSILSAGLLSVAALTSRGSVLNWNDPGIVYDQQFSSGGQTTLTQTFLNVNGSGIDVTVALTLGSTDTAQTEVFNPASGGLFAGAGRLRDNDANFNAKSGGALDVSALFSGTGATPGAQSISTDFVRITISFSEAVANVDFSLWDIDYTSGDSGYQDVVRNFKVNNSSFTPAFTLGGSDVQSFNGGTALRGVSAVPDTGTSSDVALNYNGAGLVTSLSFDYAPGDGAPNSPLFDPNKNPGLQHIGLGSVTFSAIPEVFSGRGALAACMVALAAPLLGRRRKLVEA